LISEPELREEITTATNKVEAYDGFSASPWFGHDAIKRNDPAEQEKIIKFNSLLANYVILHTALDMTAVPVQARQRGLGHQPRWPGGPLALHHRADQALRRVRHRRPHHPARRVRRAPGPPPVRSRPLGHRQRSRLNTTPRT